MQGVPQFLHWVNRVLTFNDTRENVSFVEKADERREEARAENVYLLVRSYDEALAAWLENYGKMHGNTSVTRVVGCAPRPEAR